MPTRGTTLDNFGPCQIVSLSFVWGNANQGIWKFVKFWKNTCYFQTNWIFCIFNWGVRCDVSDTGHTTCCCSFLLLTFPPHNWRTALATKIEVSVIFIVKILFQWCLFGAQEHGVRENKLMINVSSGGNSEFSHGNSNLQPCVNTQRHICENRFYHSIGWSEACAHDDILSLIDEDYKIQYHLQCSIWALLFFNTVDIPVLIK